MWKALTAIIMSLSLSTCGVVYSETPIANQLELVKQSREYCERVSAQAVSDLEKQVAEVMQELKQYKAKRLERGEYE